jgi:hypothetical protein
MRFQILSLLIILTFINCQNTFTFGSKEAGDCADSVYTFTVTGTVTTATESVTTWTPTLTAPDGATATCTMPIVGSDGGSGTITCTITSGFSNSGITLTGLTATGFTAVTLSGDNAIIAASGKSCAGLNTFTYSGKTEGSCATNEYSFTVTGTVTTATSEATTWTPTFSAPTEPTVTCSMPEVAANGGSGTITCSISSALSNSAITLTKLTADGFNDVTIAEANQAIATGKTCPLNTFEFGDKTEGSCADNVYTFTVTGTVTKATASTTTWTPTLTAPADATATCTMPAVAEGGSGTITCTITSALSNSDITLTQLVSDSFNAVTIPADKQAIATGKTCAGTTTTNPTNPTNPSNDGSKFISLNAILFSFFLLIF